MAAKTLFEKIWESHVVQEKVHEPSLLYIDLHLVHEVTSPQAFEGLRHSGRHNPARRIGRSRRRSQRADHRIAPSDHRPDSKLQSKRCAANCAEFNVML